jgi:beta-glucosidase
VDSDPAGITALGVKVTTVLEGIEQMAGEQTRVIYAQGCATSGDDRYGIAAAVQIARQADIVVLALGDRSGLTPECTTGETRDSSDLKLPGSQEDLARAVLAEGKPVAVVLITGRPYAIAWLAGEANAILQAWLPGEEGGAAIASVLFGQSNPGGKLPITFPRSVGQIPIYYNTKPAGTRSHWYGDYVNEKVQPLFPFGHGLSYTSFEYRDLIIPPRQITVGDQVDIACLVSNSGEMEGEEVVQLYIHQEFASIPRPVKELKGYRRVRLAPGETKHIIFHLPVNQLAFYDLDLKLGVEPGNIRVMVGSSSEDIRLCGEFRIAGEKSMAVKDRVFVCPVSVE